MSGKIQSVKGTRDLLPPETAVWAAVESTARRVFATYGYGEIRTPVLEPTELFVRTVGETTDIVGKEMYSFEDRKGRGLTLRPESTAPVVRAFVQRGLLNEPLPVKLFYIGPQFRYERPQKGRYRQFSQIGAELIGDAGPHSDGEVIVMLVRFLEELGFSDLTVLLNTVGDEESREAFRGALRGYLEPFRDRLGEDSRRRLEANPLRILDSKAPAERELLAGAPRLDAHLSAASREHFDGVRAALERSGIAFTVEPRLVRGLDYYTRTVFEIVSAGLGAQDAIVGGGRYDGLVAELGGPPLEAIGFAIGEDRLIEVLPESFRESVTQPPPVLMVPVGEASRAAAADLAEEIRQLGRAVLTDFSGRSVKAALKQANRRGIRHVALLGEEERASGQVSLKDLETGEQVTIERAAALSLLTESAEESR